MVNSPLPKYGRLFGDAGSRGGSLFFDFFRERGGNAVKQVGTVRFADPKNASR
jgi:hypothetical protein